ncbi:YhcN/YlaJ family sporulation lipoprotein [Paenibacillus sp. HJL G12]|uniref:YhcN/YlaJ family sporulation lipoprotein n=1 Tax=Paenibacillus dendrobii TaxID=2691084 RepID=A0A7X3IJS2_9BACL|nr:YhcN/YlaJ family sporulation lipoprotein [Paenibacillus dendrobii]MWV45254.1 YhcN/YlaJ family sporulation lipoprotein [Paenibacillus dendrobii]
MRMLLLVVLALAVISGCNNKAQDKNASPSPQNKQGPSAASKDYNRISLKSTGNSAVRAAENTTDLSLKDHLEALAERVAGVKKAHAVVFGNTAVVGIDVDGKLTRSRVGTIKYSVAEALRKDPRGKNALVTADMDLSTRIAEIGQHIQKGEPVSGFASELADIVGRIVPQLPKDVKPKNHVPPAAPTSKH